VQPLPHRQFLLFADRAPAAAAAEQEEEQQSCGDYGSRRERHD
jgi:hypothetical protein